jgi:hypothetical protein
MGGAAEKSAIWFHLKRFGAMPGPLNAMRLRFKRAVCNHRCASALIGARVAVSLRTSGGIYPMRMFCFHCRDGEDGGRLRGIHRPAHLEFIHANADHFVIVGPLKRADGLIIGSLLIVKAPDEAAAREVLAGDPYLTGGVWQSIRVDEFTPLLGDWA